MTDPHFPVEPADFSALRNLLPERVKARLDSGALDYLSPGSAIESDADRRAREEQTRAERLEMWRGNIPAHLVGATIDSLPEQLFDQLTSWADGDRLCLVLQGAVGVGKTWAAFALGDRAARNGATVAAHVVFDYLTAAREHVVGRVAADQVSDRQRLLDRARTVELLILDDLGAEKGSEWAQSYLTALLDTRVSLGLRTIVTTNTDSNRIKEIYGGRFASRLYGSATVITISGPDLRMKGVRR